MNDVSYCVSLSFRHLVKLAQLTNTASAVIGFLLGSADIHSPTESSNSDSCSEEVTEEDYFLRQKTAEALVEHVSSNPLPKDVKSKMPNLVRTYLSIQVYAFFCFRLF
jgi:hypothetical protein